MLKRVGNANDLRSDETFEIVDTDIDQTTSVVAVKGDPLSDISLLQKIDFVMKGGEVHKSAAR